MTQNDSECLRMFQRVSECIKTHAKCPTPKFITIATAPELARPCKKTNVVAKETSGWRTQSMVVRKGT